MYVRSKAKVVGRNILQNKLSTNIHRLLVTSASWKSDSLTRTLPGFAQGD
jgi:hypothetical protein